MVCEAQVEGRAVLSGAADATLWRIGRLGPTLSPPRPAAVSVNALADFCARGVAYASLGDDLHLTPHLCCGSLARCGEG